MKQTTLAQAPPATLRPWVSQLWVSHTDASRAAAREHVLPSGQMHLAVRLSGPPLRLLDGRDGRHHADVFPRAGSPPRQPPATDHDTLSRRCNGAAEVKFVQDPAPDILYSGHTLNGATP